MKLLIVLAVVFQCASANKPCEATETFYGNYINNPDVLECVGPKVPPEGKRAQCVAVVKTFCKAPSTKAWKKGTRVNMEQCKLIPKYTPIASFTGQGGKYDGNYGHAGVFISCNNGDITIADQSCTTPRRFGERKLPKVCKSSKPATECADYFYTIEW